MYKAEADIGLGPWGITGMSTPPLHRAGSWLKDFPFLPSQCWGHFYSYLVNLMIVERKKMFGPKLGKGT